MFKKLKKYLSKKKDNDKKVLTELSELFVKSPEEAILKAEQYLMKPNFTNYGDFIESVRLTQKSNSCIVSWNTSMLSARCLDCQLHDNSCICIPCYLAGKHDQHHSYLLGGSGSGNCDCGDPNFWKPEGNCPHHPGPDPNPDVTQMTPENRSKFIKVFEIAYNAALTTKNDQISIQIFDWISLFVSYGDGLRRCVSIAVSSTPEKGFMSRLGTLDSKGLDSLLNLFGKITSDHFFCEKMGSFTLKNYISLRHWIGSFLGLSNYDKKYVPFQNRKKYLDFSFHFFNAIPLMFLINECKFDWVKFVLDCIEFSINMLKSIEMNYELNLDGAITSQLWYVTKILEIMMKIDDQHDNIQRFIDSYSSFLLDYERFYKFEFPRHKEDENRDLYSYLFLFIYLYQFHVIFSPSFDASPKNKTFSLDATFSNLLKYLTSEKDIKPLSIYINEEVFISSFLPLHHLFYCLLSSQKNPISTIETLCRKNKFPMNDFCLLSSICPVRILAAIFACDRFNLMCDASHRQITYCLDKPEGTFNIFFGLVQTNLRAVHGDESFLSMILKTFGVFDDFHAPPEKGDKILYMRDFLDFKEQIELCEINCFDASVFIMSLLTDKSISSFDKVLFKRLRVIELLMNSKPTGVDIENHVNDKLSNPIFGDDLQSFAERVTTSSGSFFRLKEEQQEFTPFFPVIYKNDRNKLISKYGNKLIPIPDFYFNKDLESCFMKPSFILAMYKCMISKSLVSKQVGLAMFVLSAKNGPKYDYQTDLLNPKSITSDSYKDFHDKIMNFFKKSSFNPLLLQIKLPFSEKPTSIIEQVQSLENLGYEAFVKTDLPLSLRPEIATDKDQMQKEKKERVANLKQALMKEFKNKRNQFTKGNSRTSQKKENEEEEDKSEHFSESNDNDDDESTEKNEILCNICQSKVDDDILGFPCLSLPCIIPSLVNNKLHKLGIQLDNLECVFSVSICLHHVHRRCCMSLIKEYKNDQGVKNKEHIYNCMIDRGRRNCFLTLFPDSIDFESELSNEMNESIEDFMKNAFNCPDVIKNPIVPIKSYAGQVLILEVRHRSRPECLDNPTVPSLLHNFLLTIYKSLHGKVSIDPDDFDDPIVKLVIMLINSDSPKEDHKKFVNQIAQSLRDDYLYEFLRRAAIIEDFALKKQCNNSSDKKGNFIDWDEILSFENLANRYDINNFDSSLELPLFDTIPLAERFVSLYQPPYNLDIFDISSSRFVDILTGRIVFFSRDENEVCDKPEIPHVIHYGRKYYHGGVAMFLGLTGPNASDIIISCPKIKSIYNMDGFYVDQFGDIDRGFKRGAILSLSKDRLENALDKLLSGDIILY